MNEHLVAGIFTLWDFMIPILFTIGYIVSVKEKNEYVLFFSTFFSWYFLLFVIWKFVGEFTHHPVSIDLLFRIGLMPALLVWHLVYPFRKIKRNRRLTIFFASTIVALIGFFVLIWVGVAFSNM
ncbi:MAG: hypothetical protein LBT83_02840 [Tannerella sp.]|jgi:hypothetical protein|nr:hypothetical protein [Tannerella sp.]